MAPGELSVLRSALESDEGIKEHAFSMSDGDGSHSKMCLWNHPGNDITGHIFRSRKMVDTAEEVGWDSEEKK